MIALLTRYQDACGVPVTVVFDGSGPKRVGKDEFARQLEVLFSGAGQTADDIIERVAYRLRPYGEVLVVTDDFAERDIIIGMGGLASSCDNFKLTMAAAFDELAHDIKSHNRTVRNQFNRSHA